jgi:hypothetical protein
MKPKRGEVTAVDAPPIRRRSETAEYQIETIVAGITGFGIRDRLLTA